MGGVCNGFLDVFEKDTANGFDVPEPPCFGGGMIDVDCTQMRSDLKYISLIPVTRLFASAGRVYRQERVPSIVAIQRFSATVAILAKLLSTHHELVVS